MIDRRQAPPIQPIDRLQLPAVQSSILKNGTQVFFILDKSVEAFKIEAITAAGFSAAQHAPEAILAHKMLLEGTINKPGSQLIEEIDSIGSFLEATPSFDHGTVSLFGLSRYFNHNISLFQEVLTRASFEPEHLENLRKKELNRLKLNLEKAPYLASVHLRSLLFPGHPYGFSSNEKEIKTVSQRSLKRFYDNYISEYALFLSGHLPEDFLDQLNMAFDARPFQAQAHSTAKVIADQKKDQVVRNERFIQSSIRIGKVLFNRSHPDYLDFLVLNEVLGGYFGSRLMKNIREDKGYTYGISSHLYALQDTGYFTIGTDVNYEAEEDTLVQIQKEINLLQTELISEEELQLVKNYLLGSFTNSLSAPFAAIDKFKVLQRQGLDLSFYDSYIDSIQSVSAERLMDLANQYLQWDSLSLSIVGK